MTTSAGVDRAALVRRSIVELVADSGFRGASMAAVAERAGVATGTAYVHYESKDELVLAAYREVKRDIGVAAADALDPEDDPEERFRAIWRAIYGHLSTDPVRARFLAQVDASPYGVVAHDAVMEDQENELIDAVAGDLMARFVDLPLRVLYDLSIGPIVRLVSAGELLPDAELDLLIDSCWRAITRP